MELKEWEIEKPRLLIALSKMESWTELLLETIQGNRRMVENAADDFIMQPESHPIGLPEFEMAMREIDSPLREILTIHEAIREHYRENQLALNTGKLLDKSDFTSDEIAEVLQLVQNLSAKEGDGNTPIVCHINKDKIVLRIQEDE